MSDQYQISEIPEIEHPHPGALKDLQRLNALLKQHDEYIETVEFTNAVMVGGNPRQVSFRFDCSDDVYASRSSEVMALLRSVLSDFNKIKLSENQQ